MLVPVLGLDLTVLFRKILNLSAEDVEVGLLFEVFVFEDAHDGILLLGICLFEIPLF